MILPFFKKSIEKTLGIDIGTSSIKIVEISQQKNQKKVLENYGEMDISFSRETLFKEPIEKQNAILFSNKQIAEAISDILEESKIQTKKANFSIPDFYTFFTSFNLPLMTQKEIPDAIKYEAKNYIPLSLSDIVLDWTVIKEDKNNKIGNTLKVLVIAIPNNIVNQYQEIATMAGLELQTLEAEAFSLVKSLTKKDGKIVSIVDIGSRTTICNIVENGILKISHSFNIAGNELTEALSRSLMIKYSDAEELKKNCGLLKAGFDIDGNTREILIPLVDSILNEIKKIFQNFYQQENRTVEKIILTGNSILMPGLKEYFFEEFKKEIEIANPFADFIYPQILTEHLKEIGPSFAIAVGTALKEDGNIKN